VKVEAPGYLPISKELDEEIDPDDITAKWKRKKAYLKIVLQKKK
jgi:hypothetical protein